MKKVLDLLGKIPKFIFVLAFFIAAGAFLYQCNENKNTVSYYNNLISDLEHTVEIKDGLYQKSSTKVEDLENLLENSSYENKKLKEKVNNLLDTLDEKDSELLSANKIALKWKEAYEAEANAKQSEDEDDPNRTRVDFDHNFGYIKVLGHTLTNPPYAWISVKQNRPLKIIMTISQNKNEDWETHVTTSEDNIDVDVELSSVNPYILEDKWYERIGVTSTIGFGSFLVSSLGASYDFEKYSFGPVIGFADSEKFYGVNFIWRPWGDK